MKTKALSTLVTGLAVGLITAPTAQASPQYGAIQYWSSGGKSWSKVYRNYNSSADLITKMQRYNSSAGYVTFATGKCGAVAHFTGGNAMSRSGFRTATAGSRDSAANQALNSAGAWGHAKLLESACQH